jgi:hypothetical protein
MRHVRQHPFAAARDEAMTPKEERDVWIHRWLALARFIECLHNIGAIGINPSPVYLAQAAAIIGCGRKLVPEDYQRPEVKQELKH